MDGEAIAVALGSCPGPDCVKEVVPKVGTRLKVYYINSKTTTSQTLTVTPN